MRIRLVALLAVAAASCSGKREPAGSAPPAPAAPTPTTADKAPSWDSPEVERRASELLAKMTLEEKLGQLNQFTNGHPTGPGTGQHPLDEMLARGEIGSILNSVGAAKNNALQHVAVEKSRLKIPILFGLDVIHGYRLVFPIPLALASTWDPDIVQRSMAVAAREATMDGIRWTFSPMVDIARDARWGRIIEGAGEDPYLGSIMAAAYVRGYQGAHLSDPTSIAACVKHYVGYGAAEGGRDYNTTYIPERELREIYLPPFHAAVEAGAATLMSAFNSLNDVPATANPLTLGILKKEWGFKGFVVSDYTAIAEMIQHGIANDGATAARKAMLAGVDMDMESALYLGELGALVKAGKVPMSAIDDATKRILRVKLALGLFEHPYTDEKPAPTASEPADVAVAKQAALESFVLLKNDGPLLPLGANVHRIALIGPMADNGSLMTGGWAQSQVTSEVSTPRAALTPYAKAHGIEIVYDPGKDLAAATAAASKADIVLLAVGEDGGLLNGEAASRAHIDLPDDQPQLVEAVGKAGKPTVLLVFSGRPLALTPYLGRAGAVVQMWHPGSTAGDALVDILTGAANFNGRLTVSMPRSLGQVPLYYNAQNTGRPPDGLDLSKPVGTGPDDKYHSRYVDEQNAPLFPFGYGLSYTTFEYTPVTASAKTLSAKVLNGGGGGITVHASVKNTGKRDGFEIAQLYVRLRGTSVALPVRMLKGYQRFALKPGESRDVEFTIGRDQLAFWTAELKYQVEPAALSVWIAPDSRSGTPIALEITE